MITLQEAAIKYWIQLGADRKQLVAGIPFYGRTYTVMRPNKTEIGDQDVGIGPAGPFTLENGFMAYYEVISINQTINESIIQSVSHLVIHLIIHLIDRQSLARSISQLISRSVGQNK